MRGGFGITNGATVGGYVQSSGTPTGTTVVADFNNIVYSTTPAPGAAALLGLGGLIVTRRRR